MQKVVTRFGRYLVVLWKDDEKTWSVTQTNEGIDHPERDTKDDI